ncbi:MAG: glycosyltransferase [Halobacteriales archaeon]|nr:glycosyltransferase [Halobacteriales archaeon]
MGDEVFLTGFRDDVPDVLAASDVLVLPSFREGTPRVITEAMASGLPVVATDIAGIPEQVLDGESGYLISTGDSEGLRERLQKLADAPHYASEWRTEDLERVGSNPQYKRWLKSLDSVYQTLLME